MLVRNKIDLLMESLLLLILVGDTFGWFLEKGGVCFGFLGVFGLFWLF